jgi:prevent-host-death family protein
MASVGTYEAKTHFTALVARAEAGEEITITRHGKPVAKLVPVGTDSRTDAAALFAKLEAIRTRIAEAGGTVGPSLAELVRQGRRF